MRQRRVGVGVYLESDLSDPTLTFSCTYILFIIQFMNLLVFKVDYILVAIDNWVKITFKVGVGVGSGQRKDRNLSQIGVEFSELDVGVGGEGK